MDYFQRLILFPFSSLQIINSVVLLILLSALTDPDQYHLTSAELGGEFEFMDDASKYKFPNYQHSLLQHLCNCPIISVITVLSIIASPLYLTDAFLLRKVSWRSSNLFPSSNLICHLPISNQSICSAVSWLGRGRASPWQGDVSLSMVLKAPGEFCRTEGDLESLHLPAPHPKCLHMLKSPCCCSDSWVHSFILDVIITPLCMWHDLHKPAQLDGNTHINCIVTGMSAVTQSNSFSY